MRRVASTVRPDLDKQIVTAGFSFSTFEGRPYWDESARYEFTLSEIEQGIEAPTNELYALCLELVARAAEDEAMLVRLGIPGALHDLIRTSWRAREPSLYGRFDLCVTPTGVAKMLEFNADTPTSLYEAAVFQWTWREETATEDDQFNAIHDALVARWPAVARARRIHFASMDNDEDKGTTSYLRETARLAGVDVAPQIAMRDIGLKGERFVDLRSRPIDCLFKLYPWEWLIQDEFGKSGAMHATRFIEPAWKAVLSTKAILPLLWEMAPGHPNLLPARFDDETSAVDVGPSYVRKRCYAREGANIEVIRDGTLTEQTAGLYGGRCVVQTLADLPTFDARRPIVGSWIVGDRACGMGIRESESAITTNAATFVPHVIKQVRSGSFGAVSRRF